MSEKMVDYSDYMPKTKELTLGQGKLVVKEYNIAKRDAVAKVLFANLEFAPMIKPFVDQWRLRQRRTHEAMKALLAEGLEGDVMKREMKKRLEDQEDDSLNLSEVAERAQEIVLKVLSNDLSLIACLTLDVEENRKLLKLDKSKQVAHPVHGFKHCPDMFKWVRENMLPRREPAMLEAINETNDFVGLVKNWAALVARTIESTRETTTEETG